MWYFYKEFNMEDIDGIIQEIDKIFRTILFNDQLYIPVWMRETIIEKYYKKFKEYYTLSDISEKRVLKQAYTNNMQIENICKGIVSPISYELLEKGASREFIKALNQLKEIHKYLYTNLLNLSCFKKKNITLKRYYEIFFSNSIQYVCPFCGISTMETDGDTCREDFDHYLPKYKYPFLALIRENIFPMCSKCNSRYKAKKDPIEEGKAFYPFSTEINDCNLKLDMANSDDIKVKIESDLYSNEILTWNRLFSINDRIKNIVINQKNAWLSIIQEYNSENEIISVLEVLKKACKPRYNNHNFIKEEVYNCYMEDRWCNDFTRGNTMSYNFDFLKKEEKYDSFVYACIEAEKGLVVSYATTAILSRRALELAIKWVYSYDAELEAPYRDNLASLMHDYRFKDIIDPRLIQLIIYIQKLGNLAVHTASAVSKEQAIQSLKNLFEFTLWIDYCYSDELYEGKFDEALLGDNDKVTKSKKELQDLYERLGAKDKKLEELIKENEQLRRINTAKRKENESNREFNVNDISEFQTRKMYIDLELELNGWIIGKDCLEEVIVEGMPNNATGIGKVDYVLFGDNGKPLAVVEAKKTCVDPKVGKIQAQRYADCLEIQYGVRPIMFYTNGFEYYLWDDKSYPERIVSGIYTKDELAWLMFKRKNKQSLYNPDIKDEITNRAYQKIAINHVCDTFENNRRKALLVMATGSGKTRTAISLVDVMLRRKWVKNILFLADRTALVKQAKKNFKALLPNLSLCNLLDSKDNPESRMVFSTYPTMMNAIDDVKSKDGSRLFSSGHFDLIIIDESHRSIYKKYQDIFNYFDAMLLGLTATPKSDIDKNTYDIFELENNVPTYAYELDEAIKSGYLVKPVTKKVKLKLPEEGIKYSQLSEEEKQHFEETFDNDIEEISSEAINKVIFNIDTVDKVIYDLMDNGIKVEGGDKLGKTIIFAKNKKHADFIVKRFNALYPEYKGHFAQAVYTGIKYVDSIMDLFAEKEKLPQIAVSVDMLDTGIDIPEIVNLVFFKKIRSKTKFWQMIGRGTRLCNDLFGVGIHKDKFLIFDYCGNFEFFEVKENGIESSIVKSLTERLFLIKLNLIKQLQNLDYQTDTYMKYRQSLVDEVVDHISTINEQRFNARLKIQYIHKFNNKTFFEDLSDIDLIELEEHIAPLVQSINDDELAKRFDYIMYTIELASLKGQPSVRAQNNVINTANKLSEKGSIEKVRKYEQLIRRVQTQEYWHESNIFDYEEVREVFRELVKFLDKDSTKIYYTNFEDEILEVSEGDVNIYSNDMQSYRKKVNKYVEEHQDAIAIYKLRHNREMTEDDVKFLEDTLWQELGSKDDYKKEFGDEPLLKLVSKMVGLDPIEANKLFSEFLTDENLNINQIEFVNMIVNYVVRNGSIEKKVLNEYPFTKNGNIVKLFDSNMNIAKDIVQTIDALNDRLNIS